MHQFAELIAPSRLGRSFRWLLASSWLTNLGDGITLAAGPLLVASQTRNPLAVAMAAFLQRLPWLLFGLYAGVLADRLDRRAIVIATGLVRVAILLLLTASILTHRVDVAVVLAALFLFGVTETFGDTTSTTLLPMLVGQNDLGIANSRAMTGIVVWNQLAGPPVGAALFAVGMALPFVSEAVCVLAGMLLITRVRLPAHGARGRSARVRDEIREGWSWLWAHAAVRTLAITIFTFNVTFGAAWSVLVLYARDRLGLGAIGFGLISTAIAVGGLLGTMSYGWLERHVRLGVIMRGGLIIETLTHLALALTRWAWFALIVFVIFGAHAFIWGTTSTSVRQRAVPAQFQGRVGSVYLTGVVGGIVIGSALGGLVASAWGVTAPFWFAFAGSALILALIWRSLLQIAHADEQTRADAPPKGLTTARQRPATALTRNADPRQQCSARGGERVVDPGPQGGQGDGAGLPGGHLPAAQYQQGRDGLDSEPLRDLRRGVDVHLDQLDLAGQVAGKLLERGADHAAGPAPGCPQVDDDRDLGGLGDLTEGGIVGVGDPRQRLMALAATGRPGRCGRHPVCLAAVPAPDQPACHGLIIPAITIPAPVRQAGSGLAGAVPNQRESASRSAGTAVPAGSPVAAAQAMWASGRISRASAGR